MSENSTQKKSILEKIKSFDLTTKSSRIGLGVYLLFVVWILFFNYSSTSIILLLLFNFLILLPLTIISNKNVRKKNAAKVESELGKSSGLL
jgi:hypothetical protein